MKIAFLLLACLATCANAQAMNEPCSNIAKPNTPRRSRTRLPSNPRGHLGRASRPSSSPGYSRPDAEYQKVFKAFDTFELQTISLNKQGPGWTYMVVYLQKASDIEESAPGPGKTLFKTPLSLVYYITLDGTVHAPAPN